MKEGSSRKILYTHDMVTSIFGNENEKGKENPKRQLYLLFEEPGSSMHAKVTSISILSTIVFSITCFVLETVPRLFWIPRGIWMTVEVASTIIFTVEYSARLVVCEQGGGTKLQFMIRPMNICDLAAILPFYAEILVAYLSDGGAMADIFGEGSSPGILRGMRALRLVRLFRIFKLGRYSAGMRLMGGAIAQSLQALSLLLFFLIIGIVLASSLVYYAERLSCPTVEDMSFNDRDKYSSECDDDFNGGVSPSFGLCCKDLGNREAAAMDFPSIFHGFWWSIVTMTTVGFGDIYPRTPLGQLVGFGFMLVGLVLIALPVAVVGQKFQDLYQEHHTPVHLQQSQPQRQEAVVIEPKTQVCERIKALKIRDPTLKTKVEELTSLIEQRWDRRGRLMQERRIQMCRERDFHRSMIGFTDMLKGMTQEEVQPEEPAVLAGVSEKVRKLPINAWTQPAAH